MQPSEIVKFIVTTASKFQVFWSSRSYLGDVPANLQSTPNGAARSKRSQSLATAALLNSARKAIDTAKKAALERSRQSARKQSIERKGDTPSKVAIESEKNSESEKVSAATDTAPNKENKGSGRRPSTKVSWRDYRMLSYTSQVNRVFYAIWLVPLSRNILHYSSPSKMRWCPVLFQIRKKNVLNKRSHHVRK